MIQLNNLSIGYSGVAIIDGLNLSFEDGKVYGILAKSGVGKTTLLKTIAGLLPPVRGHVGIDGVHYRTSRRNPVYMMHQRYCNFNWLTCLENVLIAQRDKQKRYTEESCADAYLALCQVGLDSCKDKWPSQLSGGMQQRLALARTLYVKPKYLLMDEPLSALDDNTRSEMQSLILNIHRKTQNTILMVTHSQDEASKMCDQIVSIGGN